MSSDRGVPGGRRPAETMVGRTYLERGRPVVVLMRWGPGRGPRNVLIRREDGSEVIRPFRGLRRPPESPTPAGSAPAGLRP